MKTPDILKVFGNYIFTGEYAFTYDVIPEVIRIIRDHNWIILGGDVLNREGKHTYDNWFYEPDPTKTLEYNVMLSIQETEQYIGELEKKNGKVFQYVFVITDQL